jgi:cell wall assembly regulator SMI1
MRSSQTNTLPHAEADAFETAARGEIQMQSFQDGLPPPPPVSHSWKRIDRWTEDKYEELYDQLSEGCTQNDINELEHELDCSLPVDIRESLQCHDGQERGGQPTGIIFGCMLLDCEEIVQEWRNWRVVNEEYLSAPPRQPAAPLGMPSSSSSAVQHGPNPLWRQELLDKQDSQPPKAVQRAYAHPKWIPLARDWGGNNLAVDLAPGPAGRWGQIIIFGRDYDCKYVVARSWAAFLATVADDISSEKVFVNEETRELKLREFKTANVEPAYLDILRWRVDQKYGRRLPKRQSPNGLAAGSARIANGRGSPYHSPVVEERGRSAHRFPSPRLNAQSPRSGTGKVGSPLAQVSEGAGRASLHTGNSEPKKKPEEAKLDKLVEAPTPTAVSLEEKLEEAKLEPAAESDDRKENEGSLVVNGLGVEGIDEMKTVAI